MTSQKPYDVILEDRTTELKLFLLVQFWAVISNFRLGKFFGPIWGPIMTSQKPYDVILKLRATNLKLLYNIENGA